MALGETPGITRRKDDRGAEPSGWGRLDPQQRCFLGELSSSRPESSSPRAVQGAASLLSSSFFLQQPALAGGHTQRPDAPARAISLPKKRGYPRKWIGTHTHTHS